MNEKEDPAGTVWHCFEQPRHWFSVILSSIPWVRVKIKETDISCSHGKKLSPWTRWKFKTEEI